MNGCNHCGRKKVNRPLGLCWSCYYTPGVKAMYPTTSKYGRRGLPDFTGEAPLPDEAVPVRPGSDDKVLLMIARAKAKQSLFHPAEPRDAPPRSKEPYTVHTEEY